MDVDATTVAGEWWRQIPAGGDVYYQPLHPADNRWQRGAKVEAWYFADSEATTWAEWYRMLAGAGLPPAQGLPRDLWRWQISLPHVADLSNDARLARVGLPPLRPTRAQWAACQTVGEAVFGAGFPALVAESAARPGGRVLCVFRTTREVPGTEALPPPRTLDRAPVVPTGLRT